MDDEFLQQRARAIRSIVETANPFTKRRLLQLAARYEQHRTDGRGRQKPVHTVRDGSGRPKPVKSESGWRREFDEPILLPDGRKLVILRADEYFCPGFRDCH